MSRLEELYSALKTFRNENLSTEELEQKVSKLEEDIIRKEILPIVTESIEPALKQVQRELVLVVDYHPGEPISVSLSRKTNISKIIDDAKLMEADPVVQHKTLDKPVKKKRKMAPKSRLRVYYNGKVYDNPAANQTFVDIIESIGVMRVRALGMTWSKVPLVSTTEDSKYSQIPCGKFFVITHSSTQQKQKQLYDIAEKLGLKIQVDVIAQDGSIIPPVTRKRVRRKK